MSDLQIKKSSATYDVVIVGSGAGGGMAGYVLANAGIKVLMLEAGAYFDPAKDSQQLKWPWESPRRGAGTTRPFGDFDAAYGGWEIDGEPYTTKDKTEFFWFRSRMLGGRTNHWGRISLRMGPRDFQAKDGLTDDWPITYDDVKPYYDKVDRMIGVYGTKEGLENEPDGIFLPPPKPRLNELYIVKGAQKAGVKIIPGRGSVLTEALPGNKDRGACFFCGQCGRSCKVYGDFSASSCLVIPAIKTGNLKVITNAMVREVITNAEGLAVGVSYVNKEDLQEYQVNAKTVILGASAGESARILLNSKSAQHPGGLANSSGVVGHYLHDSTGSSAGGFLPQLMDRKRYNEDGVGSVHIYSPWWLDNKKLDFPRGYHIEYGGGLHMPSYGFSGGIQNMNGVVPGRDGKMKEAGGYGASLKDDYRRFYGTQFGMAGRGTAIARYDNYCEIDPNVVDKYGIPVLRFHYKWAPDEIKQAKHMQETFQEIMHNMGGAIYGPPQGPETNYGLEAPGKIIHEVGTIRMGNDPKKSALNKWCQAHDCKNLFVVDAAPFVQQGDKNATWTILALSMRTAEYIIQERKKLNV
ncbi:GMC family oxidoreductase [Mucilaginibacter rubeus]|jgi:choline dehydrogenase-like flavoprotein|uniref:GMC family oxidoreductase n=1 Tax=Mucilaginibacter rubeus TaxID=2027860 RepID=A0AAE6MKL9_9SPHI|nr:MULTISPECIES: GMC family oxidoreductase [Mucilaginibacter]QEM06933.1 GMC family oxidoreductase [Mucilaginibacter rubeus]QEM19521.1 GMC family oxidoreductase [Mucilaginibacter gossypii]QTE43928.1 GMC family oxidoreductase [Mucilaginibacter rubeus]QTE50529.1 GMC family oxidoreductase [Mucilaginibacter rubeus]QTE55614.1 GMC family oxidoreductase [Mucilaginibacter rubeus]